jgi:putative transposase
MRYGYRRIHVLLRREGWNVNPKRIYRLHKELGLQLRNKIPKRRVKAKLREGRHPATRTNEVWAMPCPTCDAKHHRRGTLCMTNWRRDANSAYSPLSTPSRASRRRLMSGSTSEGRMSLRSSIRLAGNMASRAQSGLTRAPSSSPAISISSFLSARRYARIGLAALRVSRPGKPTDNSYIESFNGKFRAECLNAHWFMSLTDAREKLEARRRHYNELRTHSVIGNKPPITLANRSTACSPR